MKVKHIGSTSSAFTCFSLQSVHLNDYSATEKLCQTFMRLLNDIANDAQSRFGQSISITESEQKDYTMRIDASFSPSSYCDKENWQSLVEESIKRRFSELEISGDISAEISDLCTVRCHGYYCDSSTDYEATLPSYSPDSRAHRNRIYAMDCLDSDFDPHWGY